MTVTAAISGCAVTFGTELSGTPPYSYTWDLGAWGTYTVPTPTVSFGISGTYAYTLMVWNCGNVFSDTITDTVKLPCEPRERRIYLPLIARDG